MQYNGDFFKTEYLKRLKKKVYIFITIKNYYQQKIIKSVFNQASTYKISIITESSFSSNDYDYRKSKDPTINVKIIFFYKKLIRK